MEGWSWLGRDGLQIMVLCVSNRIIRKTGFVSRVILPFSGHRAFTSWACRSFLMPTALLLGRSGFMME